MLAPVMVSRWTVLHYPEPEVPTSDRALAALNTPFGFGLAVPIDPTSVLLLTECTERNVAIFRDGRWCTQVSHQELTREDVARIRVALAGFAMNAIFGPTSESIDHDSALIGSANAEWPGLIINPRSCELVCHLYDYFRVAHAISAPLGQGQAAAEKIDLRAVLPTWKSPIAVELVFAERTRGGVSVVESETVRLSARLGIDMYAARRSTGDSQQGGFIILPFEHLLANGVCLGDMCRDNNDGRRGRTYFTDAASGARIRYDLPR